MVDKKLLAILVCPIDRSRLTEAEEDVVVRLNRAIAAGRVKNRSGRPVEREIEGGLIRADGAFLYPIADGIPMLLAEEAIALDQIK
ncbi:MAG: Trm112 family protein [Pirellulales bacterium]|nr:Trm112 family protein [Pirellulales bacterium]